MAAPLPEGPEAPMAEINVTPLVDVMLVLLVIFMLLAPLFAQALQVKLPAVDAPALAEPQIIDVQVAASGAVTLDRQPVRDVQAAVRQALAARPRTVIRLGGDAAADYGRVAAVIAAIQAGGGERLAFATGGPAKK